MKIVKIQGGLGNQMFQYAALRSIASVDEDIYFDTDFINQKTLSNSETFTMRKYELDIFEHKRAIVLSLFKQKLLNSKHLLLRLLKRVLFGHYDFYTYKGMVYVPVLKKRNIYLDGYFQSEKYFKHIRQELLKEFKFPQPDAELTRLEQYIRNRPNAVSVHVRRGDYMKPAVKELHGILPLSYYKNAIAYLRKNINDAFFIVFSDDPQWCEDAFGFLGIDFVTMYGHKDTEAWKDIYLMTCCNHHIIANSSFSWWGAWLAPQENAINIAPENWFNPLNKCNQNHDIVPKNWIKL